MRTVSRFSKAAFSLAEVSVALGVAAFCLITVFGLLPVGMRSNQNSIEQTAAASLVTAVAADLQATPPLSPGATSSQSPIFQIALPSPLSSSQTIRHVYCAEDGSSTSVGAATAHYLVSVGMTPPSTGRRDVTRVRILVSWPAAVNASVQADQWPVRFSGSFEAFTALNRN